VNNTCVPAKIAPTATTCNDFKTGVAQTLAQLEYTLKSGAINSVSPGVFFLYANVSPTAGGTITVTQSSSPNWSRIIGVQGGASGIVLYNQNCVKVNVTTAFNATTGTVTISGVSAGNYILGIKYDPGTLKGLVGPPTASTTYNFTVSGGGSPAIASINVVLKP